MLLSIVMDSANSFVTPTSIHSYQEKESQEYLDILHTSNRERLYEIYSQVIKDLLPAICRLVNITTFLTMLIAATTKNHSEERS